MQSTPVPLATTVQRWILIAWLVQAVWFPSRDERLYFITSHEFRRDTVWRDKPQVSRIRPPGLAR
jgi:hypothetical protein